MTLFQAQTNVWVLWQAYHKTSHHIDIPAQCTAVIIGRALSEDVVNPVANIFLSLVIWAIWLCEKGRNSERHTWEPYLCSICMARRGSWERRYEGNIGSDFVRDNSTAKQLDRSLPFVFSKLNLQLTHPRAEVASLPKHFLKCIMLMLRWKPNTFSSLHLPLISCSQKIAKWFWVLVRSFCWRVHWSSSAAAFWQVKIS